MFVFIALLIAYLAYFAIIIYIVLSQRKNRDVVKTKVSFIRNLTSDVETCIDYCEDSVLKNALSQLKEDIRFSDPMSDKQLAPLEAELVSNSEQLLKLVKDKKVNDASEKVTEMSRLLKERNRKCKMLK